MILRRAYSTASSSLRIAIVGSGPAGLYTCAGLVSRIPQGKIDVFDRSAVPYGLIQYGVAPDHYDVKRCINQFEKLFVDNVDRVKLYCNVKIGEDLTYDELCNDYDAVVLAYGANKPRKLNIPGDDAVNCMSGGDFVAWYNGGYSPIIPLLDNSNAVVVGNGNVSIDCSRILLSSIEKLSKLDIPENALKVLKQSQVSNINIFGRRGPKDASFTIKELRELLNMEGCTVSTAIADDEALAISEIVDKMDRPKKRILQLMLERRLPKNPDAPKKCTVEFFQKPVSIEKNSSGRIEAVNFENSLTGKSQRVPCGLLIYAIGYQNVLLPGVPTTPDNKLLLSDWCRIPSDNCKVYATGWCAHNPNGVIAQTQSQAVAVADEIAKDFAQYSKKDNKNGSELRLQSRKVPFLSFNDWKYVDECEKMMGRILGKLREKIQNVPEFIKLGRRSIVP
uniref:NADPH:adrenodoxin oxidoreductase, mitochondrial n=1 Tax=Panagrolaimus sp. JU765 TaxID=591449 RepID=A0AC34QJW3_9BILA